MKTITFDEFVETYLPEKNEADETGGSFDGMLFPVDSSLAKIAKPEHVWTLIEDDEGTPYVISGRHLVNRLGFFITLRPYSRQNDGIEGYTQKIIQDIEVTL